MRRLVLVALVAIACRTPSPESPRADAAIAAARLEIARAEAERETGVATLVALAGHDDATVRAAALRGLGRSGGPVAIEALRRALAGDDAAAAATALGIASALETIEDADRPAITGELLALLEKTADRAAVIEALGRAGDASALPALTAALAGDDAVAAGIALGRFGRRSIALDEAAVRAAIARLGDRDRDVRYAATYALTRGHVPPAEGAAAPAADEAALALVARLEDGDAEVRALALAGLARRNARGAAKGLPIALLGDGDWRVAVEAARLLVGEGAPVDDLRALATFAAREWVRIGAGDAPASRVHVVLEALRGLIGHGDDADVRGAVAGLVAGEGARGRHAELAAAHVRALALAIGGDDEALDAIALPHEVTGALAAGVLARRGDAAKLVARARGTDPGFRASALAALPEVWEKADAAARAEIVAAIAGGLGGERADVSGSAADAAGQILAAGADGDLRGSLERALVDRIAGAASDPELTSSLLAAAGAAKIAAAEPACRDAHASANPAVRAAARACLKALTGADPGPGAGAAPPTPDGVDPATVIGRRPRWTVETTRGTLVIELDGDAAPWHVATIAALTRRGYYDGLPFHRVVPDFVVQGGDPTGTGWGGPGFTLPSEPSTLPYARGAVGIADAGKDTGGSQWFVMHAPAPHLEARYTVIGRVVEGVAAIDQLLVGDRIVRATIE